MNRALRFAAYVLAGVVVGLVIAYGAIQILSRTDWGRERVRGFALGWLDDKIAGEVRIGRLGGGGLLSGVVIHDFAIVDSLGRTFVQADSAAVSYSWRTLLGGDIVLDEATLYHPVVNIELLPGDSLWNFERLFPDTTPGKSTPSRNLIMFDQARIIDGEVAIRRPWDPGDPPTVEDTARIILEDVEAGRVTVMRFEIDDAVFDRFIWETPLEEGKMVEVDRFRGSGFLWRQPVVIQDLQGTLTWVDSIVSFEVPRLELPATRASAVGKVVIGDDGNRYDVRLDGQRLSFADLQWLYPALPAEGAGSMILRIQSQQPKGILFLAERARITMPGTQLAGTVGIVAGDTLYFTAVDLRASPLDLDVIERLLPGGLPVEGLLIGTVEISGPLSSLHMRGDVRLEQPGSDARNAVRWAGTVDVRRERTRGLRADFEGFDLGLLDAIRPSDALHGRVTGTVEARGDFAAGIDLVASLEHREGAAAPSRVEGGGTIRLADGVPEFDLDITSSRLSLESLGAWAPALANLRGEAEGPIRLTGSADDVRVAAELRTAAGGLTFDGRVDRRGPVPRVSGQGTATAFQLRALSDSLPDASVTGNVAFDLAGAELTDMAGPIRIAVDTAVVLGVGIERAHFAGALANGIVTVDTLTAASAGVRVAADGDFGIVEGRTGTLRVTLEGERLETLESVVFDEVVDPTRPRVGGRLSGAATLAGGVSAFDLSADALLQDWHWNDERGARASIRVTGEDLATEYARLDARVAADSMRMFDRSVDSARVVAGYVDGVAAVTASAHQAGDPLLRVAGAGRRAVDGTHVELTQLALGSGDSAWVLRDTAAVRFGPVGADVEGIALGRVDGTGLLTAGGRLAWVRDATLRTPESYRALDFRAELERVPFHEFLRLLNAEADGRGLVDGTITVAGSARAPHLRADIAVDGLTWDDVGVERLTASFAYDSSLISARFEAFQQNRRVLFGEGHIPADLRFAPAGQRRLAENLAFNVQADSMPAALVVGFLDGFRDVRGVIDGSIEASGTTREPALDGALLLRGGATWSATGVRYEDLIGTVQFVGDRSARVDVRAVARDPREAQPSGSAWVSGTLDLERFADPGFDLTLQARRLLAARRRDMDLTATGDVRITGSYTAPRISGSIRIDGGTLYLDELYRQYLIVGLDDPSLISAVDTSLVAVQRVLPPPESPFLRNLNVTDATITVGPGAWLRSREMNVEVAGELTVSYDRRSQGDMRLSGTLTAVRGTYRLDYPGFARIFDVREGTVEFPGTPGIDPNLDITAAYTVRTRGGGPLDVLAVLSGTLQNPRVRLTSEGDLPISESDLASYLFFGAPTYELNVASSLRGGDAGGGGFALNTGYTFGFGYVASTLQTLAQTIGVVDYIGLTASEAAEGSDERGIGGLLAATEIELGRYISPALFVAYTQRLNSPSYSPGVRLEWRLNPQYTTELFWEDRFARVPSFGLEAVQQKKVLGFFLFREWGY